MQSLLLKVGEVVCIVCFQRPFGIGSADFSWVCGCAKRRDHSIECVGQLLTSNESKTQVALQFSKLLFNSSWRSPIHDAKAAWAIVRQEEKGGPERRRGFGHVFPGTEMPG